MFAEVGLNETQTAFRVVRVCARLPPTVLAFPFRAVEARARIPLDWPMP